MLKTYRFKNAKTGDEIHLGKLSYLWACMLGPVYVAFKAGPSCVARSLLLSVACAGAFFMLLVNLNRVPKAMQPVVLIIGVLAVVLVHSLQTISLIADYYRKRRRWSVRVD